MKNLGYLLIAIGFLYLIVAFNMNVSVPAPTVYLPGGGALGGGRIINFDLMSQRQNHLIIAALVTLVGAIMAIFAKDGAEIAGAEFAQQQCADEFTGNRDLTSDTYRLWLVKSYKIERNDVLDRFVLGDQTYDSLDDALIKADEIENTKINTSKSEIELLQAEARAEEEAARIYADRLDENWQKRKPKIIVAFVILLVSALVLYLVLRESPQEISTRLAREKDENSQLMKKNEARFGVDIPDDAQNFEITENASDFNSSCTTGGVGTQLLFTTNLLPKNIKDLFSKTLGTGEPLRNAGPDNFEWKWVKNPYRYELRMVPDQLVIVSLCVVE